IAQRLTTSMVPTKLAVRPAQTVHSLVRSSGLNCMIESLCDFWKVIGVQEGLPTTMLELLKPHAAIVQKALIELSRFAGGVRRPELAWYRFEDLTELVFAFPKGLCSIINVDQDAVPAEHGAIT